MKKMISLLLVTILAISCFAVPAMAESHPPMYKVTDAEGHTIYLLGTMHVVTSDTFPISGLDTILKNVDKVYFEVGEADMALLASPEAQAQAQAEAQGEEPEMVEDNGISEETVDLLEAFFKNYLGAQNVKRDVLRQFPVSYLLQLVQMVVMSSVQAQLSSVAVDVYVYGLAKEQGLKIMGVEDISSQLETFDQDVQAALQEEANGGDDAASGEKQLHEMLTSIDDASAQVMAMCNAYKEGNAEAVLQMMREQGAVAQSDASRNARFLETAKQVLKDGGNALFAIGLYHLIAEDGLVKTLTDAGCTVESI